MSAPRRLVPGQTHTTTRRVVRRTLLLQPVPAVSAIVLYVLGLALRRHPELALHACLVSSTHKHDCLSDGPEKSALPCFYQYWHSLVARALNAHYGRGEAFWCPGSYGSCELHGGRMTLEEQLLYIWTNAVADGLVERPELWPGVCFLPEDFGRTITVTRPEGAFFGGALPADYVPTDPAARRAWFAARRREREALRRREYAADRERGRSHRRCRELARERERRRRAEERERARRRRPSRSQLPEEVTITISRPPGYEELTLEEVRAHFRKLLDARVAEIHRERAAEGRTHFMGVAAMLAQDPRTSLGDGFPSFKLNPRIACRDAELRAVVLEEYLAWHANYRQALDGWRAGQRAVVFPHGSYWLPAFHGARAAAATGPPRCA